MTYWSKPIETLILSNAHLLAVKIVNRAYAGGWRGSSSNNVMSTDRAWKCSSQYYPGWQNISFDDKFWPPPQILDWSEEKGCYEGISKGAKWLWTSANQNLAMTTFCRKILSKK